MKKIMIGLAGFVVLGLLIFIDVLLSDGFLDAAAIFIPYLSLIYLVFKEIENNHYSEKDRKIVHIKASSNSRILEEDINEKLADLNKQKCTIVDVKIIQYNRRGRIISEAYILYYSKELT